MCCPFHTIRTGFLFFLNEISGYVRPHDLAFYVNDEPGIWSFPVNRADDINRLIKGRFPTSATCMAVVRPQVCRDFQWAADFFMLDQYPVPYMPMTWLSDSMDEVVGGVTDGWMGEGKKDEWMGGGMDGKALKAEGGITSDESSKHAGIQASNRPAQRLASVIQAFGGERYKDLGWPRLPTLAGDGLFGVFVRRAWQPGDFLSHLFPHRKDGAGSGGPGSCGGSFEPDLPMAD